MRVLAIDTALEACSAAVLDTGNAAATVHESLAMVRGHAEALLPLIARVLDRANLDFSELDRIAVTTGPGSFTGLRVGISAARGIALAAGKPAVGLSTLAAFAAPFIAADDTLPVVAAIDARHDQVYLQVFGPGGRTLVSPRLTSLREALRAASTGAPRVVGTAAKMIVAAWPAGERAPSTVDPRRAPNIDWVARLGAAADDTGVPPKPLYLRAPDAQPQMQANWRADDRRDPEIIRAQRAGAVGSLRARCGSDCRIACKFIPARLERAGGRDPAARPAGDRASRHERRQTRRIHHVADRRR